MWRKCAQTKNRIGIDSFIDKNLYVLAFEGGKGLNGSSRVGEIVVIISNGDKMGKG